MNTHDPSSTPIRLFYKFRLRWKIFFKVFDWMGVSICLFQLNQYWILFTILCIHVCMFVSAMVPIPCAQLCPECYHVLPCYHDSNLYHPCLKLAIPGGGFNSFFKKNVGQTVGSGVENSINKIFGQPHHLAFPYHLFIHTLAGNQKSQTTSWDIYI